MLRPTLSIIMPTYNGMASYLPDAIASVRQQSFLNWELLISDDGSQDNTRDYLATIKDNRIRIFFQQQNMGIFANLNFLLNQARSSLALILCQDDYLLSDGLAKVVAVWQTLPADVGFIRFNWQNEEGNPTPLQKLAYETLPSFVHPEDADLFYFVFGNISGSLSNISVRTPLVRETGGFSNTLPYAVWLHLARTTQLHLCRENVSHIRQQESVDSVAGNLQGELLRQNDTIVDELIERLRGTYPENTLRLFAHLTTDINLWNGAVTSVVRERQGKYLKTVTQSTARYHYPLPLRLLLVLGTLGGRITGPKIDLARKLLQQSNISSSKPSQNTDSSHRVS